MRDLDIPTARAMLRTRDELLRDGWNDRSIAADVDAGAIFRIRRGWFVRGERWAELWPQARHLVHVVAAHADARGDQVFALISAAALHGLPLYRARAERVHTVHPDAARRSVGGMIRHRGELEASDVAEVDGILCTSLERTVFDLARVASAEVAIVCADAALGRIGGDPRAYDEDAGRAWIEAIEARVERAAGARGVRQARVLLPIADGRSQQPLEAVTKLQLRRLGFRQPSLQVEVPAPGSGSFWMDIEIDEAGAFFECDGETKYLDEALRAGKTIEEVVLAEKRREDWVRGVTDRRVLRGGSADAATPQALAARLAAFGVELPPPREGLFLPRRPLTAGQ